MRILQYAAAMLLLVYALASLAVLGVFVAFHAQLWTPPENAPAGVIRLLAATSWVHLALWAASIALYLYVVLNLIRRLKTFTLWAVAFLLDLANWLWFHAGGRYDQALPASLAHADYAVLGANLLLGATVLVLGRTHLD
jgi:hypothetical protein